MVLGRTACFFVRKGEYIYQRRRVDRIRLDFNGLYVSSSVRVEAKPKYRELFEITPLLDTCHRQAGYFYFVSLHKTTRSDVLDLIVIVRSTIPIIRDWTT